MSFKYPFTGSEIDTVRATLLRCAIILGYKPSRKDFFQNGKHATIKRLVDYIIKQLGIEEEAKQLLSHDRRQNEN